MESLERNIKQLITRHNCVIVPGLGAFLAHNVHAEYIVDEQTFMPPHRILGFNPLVNIDDALLVSQYMQSCKLTYEKASEKMKNDICSLRRILSYKGVARFGELGTFMMDINGSITFKPDANGIDDPENYGFEPLIIEQLHVKDEKVITIKQRNIRKYIASVAVILLTFFFVTPISDRAFDNDVKASLSSFVSSEQISLMQQLSVATPVQVSNTSGCEIAPVEFYMSKKTNDATTPLVDTKMHEETTVQSNIETVDNKPITAKNQEEKTAKYYIIVASSPSEDNAKLAIEELTRKLTASYSVVKCGKRHRIAVGCFESEKEAIDLLPEYKSTFPDAWVLIN